MSDLFVELYLDEDVSVLIKPLLMSRGYEVLTTRDVNRLKSSDADQLAFATEQGRSIVTHNHRDFEELEGVHSIGTASCRNHRCFPTQAI